MCIRLAYIWLAFQLKIVEVLHAMFGKNALTLLIFILKHYKFELPLLDNIPPNVQAVTLTNFRKTVTCTLSAGMYIYAVWEIGNNVLKKCVASKLEVQLHFFFSWRQRYHFYPKPSLTVFQTTRRYIPENSNLHS